MGTHFKLEVIECFYQKEKSQQFQNFFENEEELFENWENSGIEIYEDRDFSILFSGPDYLSLQSDLLELIPIELFTPQEKEYIDKNSKVIFKPSNKRRTIFKNKKLSTTNYTFQLERIPVGNYKFIVIDQNGRKFYNLLKVRSKKITQRQLDIMRNETNQYLEGLAFKMSNLSLELTRDEKAQNNIVFYTSILLKEHTFLIGAVQRILRNPQINIEQKNKIVEWGKPKRINTRTLKERSCNSLSSKGELTYYHHLNYNNMNNQMFLYVIDYIDRILENSMFYLIFSKTTLEEEQKNQEKYQKEKSKTFIKNTEHIKRHKDNLKILKKLRHLIFLVKQTEWIKKVDKVNHFKYPKQSAASYKVLWKVYYSITNKKNFQSSPLSLYQHYWKETSLLYEIWGFTRILIAVERNGYYPTDGWIYNMKNNDFTLPFLTPGTRIIFQRENIKLSIYYEAVVNTNVNCLYDNPVYSTSLQCPDVRIDVYLDDIFMKSIVVDFKYRPLDAIGKYDKRTLVYEQLLRYSERLHSLYSDSKPKELVNRARKVSEEVWVLYPSFGGDENQDRYYNADYQGIRRVELSPLSSLYHLEELLHKVITRITD